MIQKRWHWPDDVLGASDSAPVPEQTEATPAQSKPAPKHATRRPARSPRAAKEEPLEKVFKNVAAFVSHPRNAIIIGVAVVAVAAAIVAAFTLTGNKTASPVAGWAPLNVIESRVPLQEVLVRKIRRGRIPPPRGMDVTLDFRGIDKLVIAVDTKDDGATDDIAGNPQQVTIYADDSLPFFSSIDPGENEYVKGVFDLTGSAEDDTLITKFWISYNGGTTYYLEAEPDQQTYAISKSIDTSDIPGQGAMASGELLLRLKIEDDSDLQSIYSLTLNVDNEYPDFLYRLNASMAMGDGVAWSPDAFEDITGESVDSLWSRYQDADCCSGNTWDCCS